jgi:hypothetical protein
MFHVGQLFGEQIDDARPWAADLHPNPSGGRMTAEGQVEQQVAVRRLIFFAMVVSGLVAAYLMYRRGESVMSIARQTVTNPVGSLVSEVKNAVT